MVLSSNVFAQYELDIIDLNTLKAEGEWVEHKITDARGVVNAQHQATIKSSINARIIDMPALSGMKFKKGARLVQFDCRKPQADMRASEANVAIQLQKVEANKAMASFEAISEYEVVVAQEELNKALAEKESLKSNVESCEIFAPYEGQVVENIANPFEVVPANEPLLSIVDTSQLEVSLIVPSHWLQWLKVESQFSFFVDEINQELNARVTRILPIIDPVSRTVKVIGEFSVQEVKQTGILPGMSGSAYFSDRG